MNDLKTRAADLEKSADGILDLPPLQRVASAVILQMKARRLIADMLTRICELERAHG